MVFASLLDLFLIWILFAFVAIYAGKRSWTLWGPVFYLFVLFTYSDLVEILISNPNLEQLSPILFLHALVIVQFALIKLKVHKALTFLFPLVMMFTMKGNSLLAFVGISYLSFRMIYLQFELIEERVPQPNFWQFVAFCFFPFTFQMGPINPYQNLYNSWKELPTKLVLKADLLRLFAYGFLKFFYLSSVFKTIVSTGFSGSITEVHSFGQLITYVVALFLWIYCNFSGFTNMMVAASGVLGIKVKRNFDYPMYAKNIREFWEKWHISLTDLLREIVFMPLLLILKRKKWFSEPVMMTGLYLIFFLIIGAWHGLTQSFLALGIYHGAGMTIHYFYNRHFPKSLNNVRSTLPYQLMAWAINFLFISLSMVFFQNRLSQILAWIST